MRQILLNDAGSILRCSTRLSYITMVMMGFEPMTPGLKRHKELLLRTNVKYIIEYIIITPAGFEPAPPRRRGLKSLALDHSATVSS